MGFKCGIVGLPNVGKSTIFNALTNQNVDASNYPFCTIDPNVGVVPLKDDRLNNIKKIIGSVKLTPTTLEFIDIAGLVKGANIGEGLGNQFLGHIQRVDAIAHIVRCFEDTNIIHSSSEINPVADAEIIITELILKDLETVENRFDKIKTAARTGDKTLKTELDLLQEFKDNLERNRQLKHAAITANQLELIKSLNLLTLKPTMYIANIDEDHLDNNQFYSQIMEYAKKSDEPCIPFCAKIQAELAELDDESKQEFLVELGLDEIGFTQILKTGYSILNLITFFTANENEAHAWTIPQNTAVVKAAGKIHTDFEKGFIKAEIIKYDNLIKYNSESELRDQGLINLQGKSYIVEDGDIINFKFSK